MAVELQRRDVVVIGLGAVGGVAVLPLAEAGVDVVALEAGGWLRASDHAPDELNNNYRGWPDSAQKANREIPVHRRNATAPDSPRGSIHPMMNAVGGTTLHLLGAELAAAAVGLRRRQARRPAATARRASRRAQRWRTGLSAWRSLEPYYDHVEYAIGVSGQAGNVGGVIDERGSPFEGERRRPFPMPPLRWTGFIEQMAEAARGLEWHPFPGPAAVNSVRYQKPRGVQLPRLSATGVAVISTRRTPRRSPPSRARRKPDASRW